tara:strand:- start:6 stop:428 length:423 start_codon:yes stop_codon:yes gene_type:complete
MENILNPDIYQKAKKEADKVYKKNSAYKSMFISKKYKELGGKYKTKKKKSGSTDNWTKEEWIQVLPYLEKGKKIVCGLDNKKNKVCRPFKKLNSKTPITLPELLKLHKKEDLIKLAKKKVKDMDGRISSWKTLKFIPSKK